jgi:hypothetical protein
VALRKAAAASAEPQEAARAALLTCLIVFFAQSAYLVLDRPLFGAGAVVLLDGLHAALAGLLALWLWRRRPSTAGCDLVFLLVALPYLPIFWLAEFQGAALGLVREPLLGHKIVVLGMALLAPSSLWLGAGLIAAFAVHAAIMLAALRAHGYHLVGEGAEPWVTFLFAAVSIAYLVSRANRRAITLRLAHARAEARANQQMARLFLGLRDRANTPLQTLELGTALLERRLPAQHSLVERLRKAVSRLRELSVELPTSECPPGDREEPGARGPEGPDAPTGSSSISSR